METVVAMLYNRCETATFAKIKQGVQEMMHKYVERLWRFLLPGAAVASFKASLLGGNCHEWPQHQEDSCLGSHLYLPNRRFEEGHVAQIKTVFPEAYTFRQEKNVPPFSNSFKKGSFQLTVEPSFTSG